MLKQLNFKTEYLQRQENPGAGVFQSMPKTFSEDSALTYWFDFSSEGKGQRKEGNQTLYSTERQDYERIM